MTEVHFWKAGGTLEGVQLLGKQPLCGKGTRRTHSTDFCLLALPENGSSGTSWWEPTHLLSLAKRTWGPGHFWGGCVLAAFSNYLLVIIC